MMAQNARIIVRSLFMFIRINVANLA
jgi:hypothetical protein